MSRKVASPLPECDLCEIPTARAVWEANNRLCSACAAGVAATVRMLRPGAAELNDARRRALLTGRPAPVAGDPTVFVEAFTPDVPGVLDVDAVFGDIYAPDEQRSDDEQGDR